MPSLIHWIDISCVLFKNTTSRNVLAKMLNLGPTVDWKQMGAMIRQDYKINVVDGSGLYEARLSAGAALASQIGNG
jgi:hypothetical protein